MNRKASPKSKTVQIASQMTAAVSIDSVGAPTAFHRDAGPMKARR